MITKAFNSTAKLVISTVSQTNKANTEIDTQPVTVEAKISKCSTLNTYMSFYAVHSLNHYVLFFPKVSCFICFFQSKFETCRIYS